MGPSTDKENTMTITMENSGDLMSDIHMVPVRTKDLDAVYALLAQRNSADGSSDTAGEPSVQVPKNGNWTRSDLVALYDRCFERNRAVLNKVAESSLAGADTTY